MPTKDILTKADLAELRRSALGMANPLGVAAEIAEAVEQDRLDDPDDAGDVLTLAAEIAEIRGRSDAALRYAERALAAYPSGDDPGPGSPERCGPGPCSRPPAGRTRRWRS